MNHAMHQRPGGPQAGVPAPQQPAPQPQAVGPQPPQQTNIKGEDLQLLLFSRVRELTPQEMQVLDSIITPTTVPVLFKLFPELGILFDQGSQLQAEMQKRQQGGPIQAQRPPQQPQAVPQRQPQQPQGNPLVEDNVSRGLMG